jgi:sec-independent protein translocase protein TatB
MFGMGFTEIMFIAVVAILFLGPDKLPDAMVQIAKLFKSVRNTVNEAKSSFEEEIRIKELREEALAYRKKIEEVSDDIAGFKNTIPNPVTEMQDAVTSIAGERPLDDDLLADIHEAEASSAAAQEAMSRSEGIALDEEGIEDDSSEIDEDDALEMLDDGGLDSVLAPKSDDAERPAQFKNLTAGGA